MITQVTCEDSFTAAGNGTADTTDGKSLHFRVVTGSTGCLSSRNIQVSGLIGEDVEADAVHLDYQLESWVARNEINAFVGGKRIGTIGIDGGAATRKLKFEDTHSNTGFHGNWLYVPKSKKLTCEVALTDICAKEQYMTAVLSCDLGTNIVMVNDFCLNQASASAERLRVFKLNLLAAAFLMIHDSRTVLNDERDASAHHAAMELLVV